MLYVADGVIRAFEHGDMVRHFDPIGPDALGNHARHRCNVSDQENSATGTAFVKARCVRSAFIRSISCSVFASK